MHKQRIRELNDRLRTHGTGGQILISAGVRALGSEYVGAVLAAMGAFDDFTPENDPHEEHDCAIFKFNGQRFMFKVDYYALDMEHGSDDPSDPTKTMRVLTLMLAAEY